MTQAASSLVAPAVTTPSPLTGDDIALAIAARVTAKRQLESSLANHQAQVTKISTRHTAIQAEIDGAKSAYESGQSWTVPADSVLTQMQAEATAKADNRQPLQRSQMASTIANRNRPNPPAAGAAVVAGPAPTAPAGSLAANLGPRRRLNNPSPPSRPRLHHRWPLTPPLIVVAFLFARKLFPVIDITTRDAIAFLAGAAVFAPIFAVIGILIGASLCHRIRSGLSPVGSILNAIQAPEPEAKAPADESTRWPNLSSDYIPPKDATPEQINEALAKLGVG